MTDIDILTMHCCLQLLNLLLSARIILMVDFRFQCVSIYGIGSHQAVEHTVWKTELFPWTAFAGPAGYLYNTSEDHMKT